MKSEEKEFDWFDRPGVRRGLRWALYLGAALTLVLELFIKRKAHFGIDGVFGFYGMLGFVSCLVVILATKALGGWLKRPEDYYGDKDEEEIKPEDIDESV